MTTPDSPFLPDGSIDISEPPPPPPAEIMAKLRQYAQAHPEELKDIDLEKRLAEIEAQLKGKETAP